MHYRICSCAYFPNNYPWILDEWGTGDRWIQRNLKGPNQFFLNLLVQFKVFFSIFILQLETLRDCVLMWFFQNS